MADLGEINWSDVLTTRDVDVAVDMFTLKFVQVLDLHAPWIIFQQRKDFCPWITDNMKDLMKQRDDWKSKSKALAINSQGLPSEDQLEAWRKFKIFRNKVNNKMEYDEIQYKRNKLEENINCPDKTWKLAKNFMNWKTNGSRTQKLVKKQSYYQGYIYC